MPRNLLVIIIFAMGFISSLLMQNLFAQNPQDTQTQYRGSLAQRMSPLRTPTQEVVDISTKKCSESCLKNLFEKELYFSFLAAFKYSKKEKLSKKINEMLHIAFDVLDPNIAYSKTSNIKTRREPKWVQKDSEPKNAQSQSPESSQTRSGESSDTWGIKSKEYLESKETALLDYSLPDYSESTFSPEMKIALLIPQKSIGRYSITSADSILLYLIASGEDFEFKSFDSINEERENVLKAYESAKDEGFSVAIAILTPKGMANLLSDNDITMPVFIPTINIRQAGEFAGQKNVFFGGIDYAKQVDMMLSYSSGKGAKIINLIDDGRIGGMLGTMAKKDSNVIFNQVIDSKMSNNFKNVINKFMGNIRKSTIFLNTSIIKTGLIVPQIGNTRISPIAFLSSQLNYNISLLGLMPKEDTRRLFIVSAIPPNINQRLLAFGELMSADLQYDWVNYATTLSLESFLSLSRETKRLFSEMLDGNQIKYNDIFYGVKDSHFVPVSTFKTMDK